MNDAFAKGRVVRFINSLTDAQIVELVARLSRTMQETHDVEPERLRDTLRDFVRQVPKPQGVT